MSVFLPMSDIGECLNGEIFYSLKEDRAKILGFLPLAGYAGAAPRLVAQRGTLGQAGRAA
jgi:hypothetical protein